MSSNAVLWLRRDLRLHDHPALDAALSAGGMVAPLFVVDERLIGGRFRSPNRLRFLADSLSALDQDLRARGNRLHFRIGPPESAVAAFAREAGARHVFVSRDYSPYGRWRDAKVRDALKREGITLTECPGALATEPEDVVSNTGQPYSVFTPFHRRWNNVPRRQLRPPGAVPGVPHLENGQLPAALAGIRPTAKILEGGEAAARSRLQRFAAASANYASSRDVLSDDGTSRLSQDLRWGLLSPVEVLEQTATSQIDGTFAKEVCWRDFYAYILWHFPWAGRKEFQPATRTVAWESPGRDFEAWKAAETGYPVVDAAMRQLVETGWMHNRARMVAASFLTKDLLMDWRLGESFFMEHLVDGDVASNNGGWQWAASTGTDAQPYFRVFNPVLQGQRFDPSGAYVRRWLPALRNVPDRFVHEPWKMPAGVQSASGCRIGHEYPAPIVDHADARLRAIARFAEARERFSGPKR